MKTRSEHLISVVAEMMKLREKMKLMVKAEQDLKAEILAAMGSNKLLEAGEYAVLIETRQMTQLDKAALIEAIGPEEFSKHQVIKEYEAMSVKPLGKGA